MNAQRTVERGRGILLEKDITATTLREGVDRVAQNASYRERAQSLQQVIREAGGYMRAADTIVQFTRKYAKK